MSFDAKFNNPVKIIWRNGDENDPYPLLSESWKIIQNIIVLSEIPDEFYRVRIIGFTEVFDSDDLSNNKFIVNYQNGIVAFSPNDNNKTVSVEYKGRGIIQYPASRIYSYNENTNVTQTLQEVIDSGKEGLEAVKQINEIIKRAETATTNAESGASKANEKATLAEQKATLADEKATLAQKATTDANNKITEITNKISEATTKISEIEDAKQGIDKATNDAKTATTNANNAVTDLVHKGVYNSTTAYKPRNIVTYNGASYMNIVACTNILPTDTSKWQVLSSKGDQGVQGVKGDKGDKGDTGTSFIWKGVYSSLTNYVKNDIVSYNGSTYIAKQNSINNLPTNSTYWDVFVLKGSDGVGSVDSVNGKSGIVVLTAEEVGAIPSTAKGVPNGVAGLNAQGKVVDASGNEVEGKVKSVNGQTGDVTIDVTTPANTAESNAKKYADTKISPLAEQLSDANRETATLTHGLQVLNGGETSSPVNLEISGNTLVSLGNSTLDANKKYVLANKKFKLKWADATLTSGIAKFQGKSERPTIIRIANFEGKVSGSTVENPHLVKSNSSKISTANNTLQAPASVELTEVSQNAINNVNSLNGIVATITQTINGNIAQTLFSFNLIEEVERQIGKIPKTTVAEKVQWLKDNVAKLVCNWHGFGSSVGGNKASFGVWSKSGNTWTGMESHTLNSVGRITYTNTNILSTSIFHTDGIIHFLAYAEPSNGTTASTINTDYIEIEIELKPTADFWNPKVPLYEVDQSTYDKIGVLLTDSDVEKMFPSVDGVQHLQNPAVIAEGENLLPPFSEWSDSVNAVSAYETTSTGSYYDVKIPVGQTVSLTIESGEHSMYELGTTNVQLTAWTNQQRSYTIPSGKQGVRVYIRKGSGLSAKNPILNLGSTAKPFVPRNSSYLYAETTLAGNSDKKDILSYNEDKRRWEKTKWWMTDVVLDGKWNWTMFSDYVGYKQLVIPKSTLGSAEQNTISLLVQKYSGTPLTSINPTSEKDQTYFGGTNFNITVSDTDSGWTESMTPSADLIKSYFNGWKYTGNGTTHSWVSIVDGSIPPTNTLAYVSKNMATGYTPYKLSYVLAKPEVIDVSDKVEGDVVVNGLTQVEATSGVIVREKVTPQFSNTTKTYLINEKGINATAIDTPLKYKTEKIISIYKNGKKDNNFIVKTSASNQNGIAYAETNQLNFDPTAEYTVTYLVLDRHLITANVTEIKATYAKNIRTALNDTINKVADIETYQDIQDFALDYIEAKADNNRLDLNNHIANKDEHVTLQDKDNWNAKETTTGSQAKADKALEDAKKYTDSAVSSNLAEVSHYEFSVKATVNNQTKFTIPLETFDSEKDKINFFVRRIPLRKDDVTVVGREVTLLNDSIELDDSLYMEIIKNIKTIPQETLSGSYIQDGTIPKQKFDTNVQASLGKADNSIQASEKGVAGGVAKVDADGDVIDALGNKLTRSSNLSSHIGDKVSHITNEERNAWNAKSNFSGNYNDLTNKPNIETPTGSQDKANKALEDAKTYTDSKITGKITISNLDPSGGSHGDIWFKYKE